MTEMQEALAAISGQVELAPNKVPDGKTVVGIRLDRDESRSGKFMTSITKGWQPQGMAVAIRDGHVIGANYLFGRWAGGLPKISACHKMTCKKCGKLISMPSAVWEAKDLARRAGVKDDLDKLSGYEVLRRYGSCSCGGKWGEDAETEKKELTVFADEVMRAVSQGGQVPELLEPAAFTVHEAAEAVDLGEKWKWLKEAMAANGRSAIPFSQNTKGDALLFNPGFWLGWVDDIYATGLFFLEKAPDREGRIRGFNPAEISGL